jgi:uncharacterized membrane protein
LTTTAPEREEPVFLEPRWPIVAALGFFIAISIVLRVAVPDRSSLGPVWLVPAVEVGLVLVLLAADPARVSGHRRRLRRLAIGLVGLLACAALASTVQLIVDLVEGTKVTNSASALLASGALIWLGNVLVFSLFYWLLDSGGPLARYRGDHPYPDFAFTQHMSPELSPPGWRTQYADYLILALTTSTAFSPTDVMPMARWAKLTMSLQSLIALTVVGLVIARAVNVFA